MEQESGSKMKKIKGPINMLVTIYMIKSMVKANSIGRAEINISAPTKMIKGMVTEKCIGTMAPSTKEIGNKACNTDSVK